ncbi:MULTISPECIES: hypothetical protein [Protofrankia]|uniref:hypothetical protein n=1 Tax=Protofrankia TaxID=2994361 RepID=UPI000AF0251C|nr:MULTISPECIES: hypothetical protein [Protofrankia]
MFILGEFQVFGESDRESDRRNPNNARSAVTELLVVSLQGNYELDFRTEAV